MFSFFNKSMSNNSQIFFDLNIKSINGDELNLAGMNGKTILLVNVASNCGFTKQYDELQKLYDNYRDKGLIVLVYHLISLVVRNQVQKVRLKIFVRLISISPSLLQANMMLRVQMHILYIYGQKKHMENQQFRNGIFIKS